MSNLEIFRIDNIKWWITTNASGGRVPVPLCPKHNLRLTAIMPTYWDGRRSITGSAENSIKLNCAEGPHEIPISRKYFEERQYVIDRIDAKVFKDVKILNLDDEAVPIAKDKKYSKDGKLFVTSQLMESKRGIQVVIYAGKKGSAKKTQILISPSERRLAFDQSDLHPTDVFAKVEATFLDGSKSSIEKLKKE